jgi:hypothetical protein
VGVPYALYNPHATLEPLQCGHSPVEALGYDTPLQSPNCSYEINGFYWRHTLPFFGASRSDRG